MPPAGAPISAVAVRDVIKASEVAFADGASHFAAAAGE